ncbi:MAG: F0F1 ATP synthase subunit A [Candidatus Saccharimonas sp.]
MTFGLAASEIHVKLPTEVFFHIGPLPVTNAMILGAVGVTLMLAILGYTAYMVKNGRYNRFVGLISWAVEGMYGVVLEIVPDRKVAKSIAPLALTIFFTVLATYWCAVLPGVGSVTLDGKELFRELPSDLNFTFALALIAMVTVQYYAIRAHGFFGNMGRYFKNPLKDPIGSFEGLLELIGEFSRLVALSLRLFGNAFAGAVLLLIVGILSGWLAALSLPFVMLFELFIGFIQAYVFFVLTIIFTSLAIAGHGDAHSAHSSADTKTTAGDGLTS